MKKIGWIIVFILILITTFACSGTKEIKQSDEEKIKIFILTDIGNSEDIPKVLYANRMALRDWTQQDLIKMLNKEGYDAIPIEKRDEYIPGTKKYLLKITILSQHNTPRFTRISVFGGNFAGANTLTNRYEFFGEAEEPLFDYEEGSGSTKSQRHNARKLNKNAVQKITEKLMEIHNVN